MEKPAKTETATAIANYEAADDSQISLEEGDFIEIYRKETDDWWYGRNLRGKLEGWIPASYVKVTRGKVGSVAATIGARVPNGETAEVPKVSVAKPPLLPKPMISPKPDFKSLSPRNGRAHEAATNKPELSDQTSQQTVQTTTATNQTPSTSESASSETHFVFKAKLVEDALNRRLSTVHLDEDNGNQKSDNRVSTWDADDDWENEEFEVVEASNATEIVVVAIAQYEPTGPDQLPLKIGDVVEVHQSSDPNWWRGKLQGSDRPAEWFPASYVKSLGKEYQHFGPGEHKARNAVKKSNSKRSLLDGPMRILQKVAATAAVMSPTSPHWHNAATPSPKPESTSRFYAVNDALDRRATEDSFDSDDSDYGTDQTSVTSVSKLYTIHAMLPGDECKSEEKQQEQRRLSIIYELVTTEERYIKDMYFTLTNFQQSLATNGLLTEDEVKLIFRNLHQIYEANYNLYDALTARLGTASGVNTRICDTLLAHLPTMLTVYQQFIAGHNAAKAKVDIKCSDPYFADFLSRVSAENEYFLPLTQYLAKPTQRILQYPNLLEHLLKYTDSSSEDYLDCQKAVQCAKSFCKEIDDRLKSQSSSADWQPYESLSWLQTHLVIRDVAHLIDFNSETQFLGPRALLFASFYQNVANQKATVLFLLNDLLILALPQRKLPNALQVANFFDNAEALNCKFTLHQQPFLLDDVTVSGQSVNDTTVELYFGSLGTSIKLHATSYEQYRQFLEKFDAARKDYCEIQQKNSAHRHSVELQARPIAILSLDAIEAVQLYTRSYTLNAYCKVAIGRDWSNAHSVTLTKAIHVDLLSSSKSTPGEPHSGSSNSTGAPHTITWKTNYLLNIYSAKDHLLIRCFNETRYAPHQLLGEAALPIRELLAQSKHLKVFTKGLPLVLPNGQLGKQLLANYQIRPCLLVKIDIL